MFLHSTSSEIGNSFNLKRATHMDHPLAINRSTYSQSVGMSLSGSSWASQAAGETRKIKNMLKSSSVSLGSAGHDLRSTARGDHRDFSREECRAAQGAMNAEAKKDLSAVHYTLGDDKPGKLSYDWYETWQMRQERAHWNPKLTLKPLRGPAG
ncbi:unnamed protein product [Polarella glacialis]|uniref:Uncharacterized protein n=1 Tax=Polarella glacialis TaxID=89957 RepID=A0A813LTM8_POLGL|nr:unnamed protein product [Polarella glacialis]CAE8737489.1 unnamed protein product [Polarella glacialis]